MLRCLAVLVCVLVAAYGCGGDASPRDSAPDACDPTAIGRSGTAACETTLPSPSSCASSAPRYDDVAPILASRCTVCHFPGGAERARQFDTYPLAYQQRKEMLVQVYGCRMPPPCEPVLGSEERDKLLTWLVCGAAAGALPPTDGGS